MLYIGELSGLMAAICWSGSSFAFSSASERIGPLQLNINRMILASIFLFITIILMQFSLALSFSQIGNLVLSGAIGLVFGDTFLFKAYQHIGARISMLLMSLTPVISAILAFIFLKEVLAVWAIVGILVTVGGIALIIFERSEVPISKYKISKIGILYGLLGAVGQSVGLIFAKAAFETGEINGFVATFVRITAAVIIMLPVAILVKRYKNPVKLFKNDLKALRATLTGTILGPYLGITFSLIAVKHAQVGIAATLMSTMPILMLPIAKYVYNENINWRAISGAFLAVGGVAILFLK